MSFETKMQELRTSIDTKIDETLRGPKTIDKMTAAVETIVKGSGGETSKRTNI
jgi:hypothetical protein